MCWYDIYKIIDKWLVKKDNDVFFMFRSFQNLLVHEGLGPVAPISHNSILSYYSARYFVQNTLDLTKRLFNKEKEVFKSIFNGEKDFELANRGYDFGRIGFSMLNNWRPGIFVGFLIDGEDHKTKPILGERSPDFSIILSFAEDLHNSYSVNENYIGLIEYLQVEIEKLGDNWDFYNHIKDERVEGKNYWHPIHIRKPMIDLFKGTLTAEEQEARFLEAIKLILPIIIKSEYYTKLKKDLKESTKAQQNM